MPNEAETLLHKPATSKTGKIKAPPTKIEIAWKILSVFIFIYFGARFYPATIEVNGHTVASFLKPLAIIPAGPIFFAAFIIQFLLQRQKQGKENTLQAISHDAWPTLQELNQHPGQTLWNFYFKPVFLVLKYSLIYLLLLIPFGLLSAFVDYVIKTIKGEF